MFELEKKVAQRSPVGLAALMKLLFEGAHADYQRSTIVTKSCRGMTTLDLSKSSPMYWTF
jgi:hypothetical protein